MRFFAKAARVIVLFRVPPFRRIFLRSSAPKRNCAHFPQMLPPIFRRRSSRSFTGPCTKCGMRFILSLSKCRSLRRSAARHRNLSKPATGFSACSLIFLRRLVSKSNRCFRAREICAQQSDQPCCICTAEVPASAVLLFASLHLLHAPLRRSPGRRAFLITLQLAAAPLFSRAESNALQYCRSY